jgi:hypothetical protein
MVPEWIACKGSVRIVDGGLVICPRGDLVDWTRCAACRFLETVDTEGRPERDGVASSAAPVNNVAGDAPCSRMDLVIELL